MDFVGLVGFIGSFVTFEEAGRSWISVIKEKIKRKGVNLDDWDSEDTSVQACLDKFKSSMWATYKEHIFTDEEIIEVISLFFQENAELRLKYDDKNTISQFITEVLKAYNEYTISLMSTGEKVIHDEISDDFSKIVEKLDAIESQPQRENIKRFFRAIERSKDIELANIEELINGEYEIDRSKFIDIIRHEAKRFISIQGGAGSGKSVVCKKILSDKKYVLVARAESFASGKKANEIWDCDVEDAILWLNGKSLYIFIDAIEFIADCGNDAFVSIQELYRLAEKYNNVYIITSCRNTDRNAFIKIDSKYKTNIYEIPELDNTEINKLEKKYPIISYMEEQNIYADLLSVPFYINLVISGDFNVESIKDENDFRTLIWEKILCLRDKCVKYHLSQSSIREAVENIVFSRAKNFVVGVDKEVVDSNVLAALVSEGIVVKNGNLIRLKYDIFEDICFERYFDRSFEECKGDYDKFFNDVAALGRCVYRRYQIWISNKLFIQENRDRFIYALVVDDNIPDEWRKQTEIGIVKSKYCGLFFSEYAEVLDDKIISDIINITNLYAFEPKIISNGNLFLDIKPIGAARENLIKIVAEHPLDRIEDQESIIKLCDDYSKYSGKKIEVERDACEIIETYISSLIEECTQGKSYLFKKVIVRLFYIVSRMAKASKDWLKNFIEKMIEEHHTYGSKMNDVAEDILEAVVKNYDPDLVTELPEIACKTADALWCRVETRKRYYYDDYDLHGIKAYGLSDNADHFRNDKNGVFSIPFIWHIMQRDFIQGFEWAISFVNKAIQAYVQNESDSIIEIEIYFPDLKDKKKYYGNDRMWIADTMDYNVPLVLGDIIYVIKRTLINTIRNTSDKEYARCLAEYVKRELYEKSNNILLLSIIESIGLNFEKELPGYAIELASSMKLIYWDINRYGNFLSNPTKELLEKHILMSVGIPNLKNRYEKDEKCAKNLQKYMMDSYLLGNEKIREKCNIICDYLYCFFSEKDYPNENFQIQKMDMRQAKRTVLDDTTIMVEPEIRGEAKKLLQNNEEVNRLVNEINQRLNDMINCVSERDNKMDKLNQNIDFLLDEMRKNTITDVQYEKVLIVLIASALSMPDLPKQRRNILTEEWINRISKLFEYSTYAADLETVGILWEQLQKDIDYTIKERILKILLESIMSVKDSGLIDKVASSAKKYLENNPIYANRVFITILKLAEYEMKYQKYNAECIKDNREDNDFEFVPNMGPRFRGVDQYISNNCTTPYESQRDSFLQKYLYKDIVIDISDFDMQNYDIGIMCYLPSCGLNLTDERFASIIKEIVLCMINIWHKNGERMRAHEIIDTYKEYEVSSFFQKELSLKERDARIVYDVLFKGVDFSMFTKETVEFYEDIFGIFLSVYVDGFREKGNRADIEKKIRLLESYIESISEEWVKRELEKSLFLSVTRYSRWDVNKVKAEYSYKDKCFLNKQIIAHGNGHFKEVINTVYMLNIDCLLPEIIVSLGSCFSHAVTTDKAAFVKEIKETQAIVDKIILKAFVDYSDAIKKDNNLVVAYEEILNALTSINNEKAAVLLDEFRIH